MTCAWESPEILLIAFDDSEARPKSAGEKISSSFRSPSSEDFKNHESLTEITFSEAK